MLPIAHQPPSYDTVVLLPPTKVSAEEKAPLTTDCCQQQNGPQVCTIQNPDHNLLHHHHQQLPVSASQQTKVKDYLCQSIFTCLCCFWPLGIVAIIFSCMTRSATRRNDQLEASRMSRLAGAFSLAALLVGIACLLIAIVDNIMMMGLLHGTSLYLDYSMVTDAPEFDQSTAQMHQQQLENVQYFG